MRQHILIAAFATLSLSGVAVAHEAGQVILRGGVTHIAPKVDSSRISVDGVKQPGSSADINSSTQVSMATTYMITSYFGVEAMVISPSVHKIRVKGLSSEVDGKLGEVTLFTPMINAQLYLLNPKSKFRPYAGLGVNHAMFYDERLTRYQRRQNGFRKLELSDSVGLTGHVGADIALTKRLLLNASVRKLYMSTTAKAKWNGDKVKVKMDIDPWVYTVGVGYRF